MPTRTRRTQPTFTKNGGLIASQQMKDFTKRDIERQSRLHVANRRDFRSPAQRVTEVLKTAMRTTPWPVIL